MPLDRTDFYVYVHRTVSFRSKGEIFYVGKGSGYRAWHKRGRSAHWKSIVAKYGYSVEIVMRDLTEKQAFDLEKALVEFSGREVLCNMTAGGDGVSGHKHSDQSKKKIADAGRGRTHSDSVRRIISESTKGNSNARGIKRSDKDKQAISLRLTGFKMPGIRPVSCSNGKKFASLSAARDWLKSQGWSNAVNARIVDACKGKSLSAYGFEWKFINDNF